MINKIFQFGLLFYVYLFFLNIEINYGKVITIRNNESFKNVCNNIKDLQNDKNGLTIKFEDTEYDMTELEHHINIEVNNDITFIGNSKGTIFHYKNEEKGVFTFTFPKRNSTITFENIIFENAGSSFDFLSIIKAIFITNNNSVIFNNCVFQNNYILILDLEEEKKFNSKAFFNNCDFL